MTKKKVMLIDESEVCSAISSSLFSNDENFEIIDTANNEAEALSKLNKSLYELIIIEPEIFKNGLTSFISKMANNNKTNIVMFPSKYPSQEVLDKKFTTINKPRTLKMLSKNYGTGKEIIDKIYDLFGIKEKIKVMIIDDAALMRVLISNLLATDKRIQIVGTANNGQEALDILSKANPDVILLDIEMPVMNGLEFLRHARLKSNAKVIILSSVATQGSAKASQALSLGAEAIITKPSGAVSLDLAQKSGNLILDTIHRIAD